MRGEHTLATTLPLTRPGTYKVRLIAEATGFENRFSPEYLIDVRADLVPAVRIDLPQGDQTMPPGGVVHLVGEASDDVGLLSVSQETRTKSGDWTTARTLAERPASPYAVGLKWDLQTLELRTGDEIFTRLTATDLKNSKSHSNIVRILITSSATDPEDAETLRDRENLQAVLADVARAANSAKVKANELRQASNDVPLVERERLLAAARGAMEQLDESQQRAEQAAKELLPRIDDTTQSEDMILVAKAAAKTRNAFLADARRALEELTPPPAAPPHRAPLQVPPQVRLPPSLRPCKPKRQQCKPHGWNKRTLPPLPAPQWRVLLLPHPSHPPSPAVHLLNQDRARKNPASPMDPRSPQIRVISRHPPPPHRKRGAAAERTR